MKKYLLLISLFSLTVFKTVNSQIVTTFAGTIGGPGASDGTGPAARFNYPYGVCADASGNIYVADVNNHKIRKITPAGVVTTLAGSGTAGSTDATGIAAGFNNPQGVCADPSGNIYVADKINNKIRKITPAGVVTTFAGSGTAGSTDATGTAAGFNNPGGVCFDASGNLYVADLGNQKIRKITPAGVVTTFAGSGAVGSTDATGIAASFNGPNGVCFDGAGNLYVADQQNHKIRKITSAGVVTTFAGSGAQGSLDATGTAASFRYPSGVCADASGNMYVADVSNQKIRKITAAGVVTTFLGSGSVGSLDASGTSATFWNPYGVCSDGSGNIYIADFDNHKIRKSTSTGVVTTFAGSNALSGSADGTGTAAGFFYPEGVCADASGNIYVADAGNLKIRQSTATAVVTTFAGSGVAGAVDATGTSASFFNPGGVCSDNNGVIYVADTDNNKIRKITPAGAVTTFAGSGSTGSANGTGIAASFSSPSGICSDAAGNIYVGDLANHKIRKISAGGVVTTFAGSGTPGSADGTGTAASFNSPYGVCSDISGNIYVADYGNHTIRKITPAGVVSTLVGVAGVSGSTDGTGTAASFQYPTGVCSDASGNIYVADRDNHKIRKVTAAGVVTTLAGSGIAGADDGTGIGASFNKPVGVCLDAAGSLFVADRHNHKIRKISFCAPPDAPINATSVANTQVCAGNTTVLTATSTAAVNWYTGATGGVAIATGTTMSTSSGLAAGSYTYYAEANTCTVSVSRTSVSFTVNPTPTISVNSGSICAGQSYTLVPNGASTYTYSSGSTIVSPTTTASYSVTGTNAQGCVSSNIAISTVSVNALPTISVNNGAICPGNSFSIVPTGTNTYSISGGTFNVSPTATTNYSITGTSAQGCVSSNTAISTVTVNSLPTISVNSGAICSGNSFSIVPTGANTYTISGGTFNVSPTATTNYSITGTSAQGCVSSNTAISTVTVNSLPTISVNSGAICSGNSFSIVPTGANTYTISGGTFNVSPTATNNYSITGTSAQGCVSSNTAISTVTVNSLPVINALSSNSTICTGQTATLTANGATTYVWNTGSTGSSLVITPTTTTVYTVTGTSNHGCPNSASITQSVSLCTGIEDVNNKSAFVEAYPNPTNGIITVKLTSDAHVIITNNVGQIVFDQFLEQKDHRIDLTDEAAGMYLLTILCKDQHHFFKLIKQ